MMAGKKTRNRFVAPIIRLAMDLLSGERPVFAPSAHQTLIFLMEYLWIHRGAPGSLQRCFVGLRGF